MVVHYLHCSGFPKKTYIWKAHQWSKWEKENFDSTIMLIKINLTNHPDVSKGKTKKYWLHAYISLSLRYWYCWIKENCLTWKWLNQRKVWNERMELGSSLDTHWWVNFPSKTAKKEENKSTGNFNHRLSLNADANTCM